MADERFYVIEYKFAETTGTTFQLVDFAVREVSLYSTIYLFNINKLQINKFRDTFRNFSLYLCRSKAENNLSCKFLQ